MPKQTFFNLPTEKQEIIIAAAKKEFSAHAYHDASINRIIKDAAIPRGSFYMYFENKEDIFYYILESFQQKIQQHTTEKLGNLNQAGSNLMAIYIEIFDTLITSPVLLENKNFFISIFTHMNISVAKELLSFKDEQIQKQQGMFIKVLEKLEMFEGKTPTEITELLEILRILMVDAIVSVFSEEKTKEQAKASLEIKIQLIKNGIGKKQ